MTKLALVGAGWSGRVHALAIAGSRGASLATVSASTLGGAEPLAADLQVRAIATDRLPARADAVVIATPSTTHAALAVALLDGGTPVLVEKPLATTLADADEIVDTAERTGVAACYAENLLFSPILDRAADLRRPLGPLRHLEVRCTQPSPDWGHYLSPLPDGGVLLEVGPHAIAVAMVLAGDDPIIGVRAKLASSRPDGADDVAHVEMRHASELISVIDLAWGRADETTEWSAQVASDTGVVRVEFRPEAGVEVDGIPLAMAPAPEGLADPRLHELGYVAQVEGFAGVLARRGGRVCPVGFGRAVLEIICVAYLSAGRDGAAVELPFTGDRTRTPMQLWRDA